MKIIKIYQTLKNETMYQHFFFIKESGKQKVHHLDKYQKYHITEFITNSFNLQYHYDHFLKSYSLSHHIHHQISFLLNMYFQHLLKDKKQNKY